MYQKSPLTLVVAGFFILCRGSYGSRRGPPSGVAFVCTIEDDEGKFFVQFPDLENVFTEGDTMEQAMELAADVLPMMLCGMEDKQENIPAATPIGQVKPEEGQALAVVTADTDDYRKKYDNKAVPRTLSLPHWMDTKAREMNLSLSSVLQKALLREFESA